MVILLASTIVFFGGCTSSPTRNNDDEDLQSGIIRMVTISQVVRFRMAGSGVVFIDWGDKSDVTVKRLDGNYLRDYISHEYKNNQPHTITIRGFITHLNLGNDDFFGFHLNRLTSLCVKDMKSLVELLCYQNALTQIDVSNNSNLQVLDIHGNRLKDIDLRNNKALKTLYISNNQLTS